MKHLLKLNVIGLLLLCYAAGYSQPVAKEDKTKVKGTAGSNARQGSLNMQGAYSLVKQVLNDGTSDSVIDAKQFKIYTDRYMMYAAPRKAGDSLASYGIGTYTVQNGKVVEQVFYTASGGAHNDTFELAVNKTGNGYTQVIHFPEDQGKKYLLTEEYQSAGKPVKSPLDGAWKQTKTMYIPKSGTAFTDNNPTQFKVYQSGHFVWANTSQDSASNKPVSFFGYGSFEMNGTTSSKEVNSNSSFATALIDKPVTVQLKFTGKDSYEQTIKYPNGDRAVEVYERLK